MWSSRLLTVALLAAISVLVGILLSPRDGLPAPRSLPPSESVEVVASDKDDRVAEERDAPIKPACNATTSRGGGGVVPLYPCDIAAYHHPYGTCKPSERRIPIDFSEVMAPNGSARVWPMYPDRRLDFPTEHERCHFVMVRMLLIFAAVMKELGLKNWFVTHGTLLGAVRHGGMIAWDVDIDVTMPRSHITLLRKMWRKHFPRDMFLQTEKTETSFHMWTGKERAMRVKDRYSTFQGVRFSVMKRGKKYKMKKWHLGAQIDIIPLERRRGRMKLLHHILDSNLIYPLGEVCFENIMLPAPGNISGFLTALYGPDYMQVPPNPTFHGPTTLPCLATRMSPGSAWSLSWDEDHPANGSVVVEPRADPYGSFREDFKVPYTLYYNSKG